MTDKQLLTAAQLRKHLQISRSTMWRYEKAGKIKPIVVGSIKRYESPK